MSYATLDQIYVLGLSAQAFVVRPRPLESYGLSDFDPATGRLRLTGHGFGPSDLVYLTVVSGGSLPSGATALTYYYPIVIGNDVIQLSSAIGGAPLTFASAGGGWALAVDPARRLMLHAEERSAFIDQHLTAHSTPILADSSTGRYPPVLVGLCARMTARAAVTSLQVENAQYRVAIDRLMAMAAADGDTSPPAQKGSLLGDWKSGVPIYPNPIDQNTVPDNSARARCSFPAWVPKRTL